jgi:hypothetical protein
VQLLEDLAEHLEERPVADDADDLVAVAVGGDAVRGRDVFVHRVPEGEAAHVVLGAVTLCRLRRESCTSEQPYAIEGCG